VAFGSVCNQCSCQQRATAIMSHEQAPLSPMKISRAVSICATKTLRLPTSTIHQASFEKLG